ncbi:family 20 glycosylhydrolase [Parabacteroides sp. OttesenSCG-928-G06]|nr:family 20 glycosylhydrolase [Parabacteroides sp. OttesenSCG-928-K15]MDL2282387.1 family 20 glycosylhydrolase [Parabacteroides sp. OttesenSCG-928-G06]
MKKLLLVSIATFLLTISGFAGIAGEINVIPRPQSLKQNEGTFLFTSKTTIGIDKGNREMSDLVALFQEKISPATGFDLQTVAQGKGTINFYLDAHASEHPEGYQLIVDKKEITVKAPAMAGLFYGMQTILQLLPKEIKSSERIMQSSWTIPAVEIKDQPEFMWRGLMLDVSRHWFTKEEVLKYIDELAEYKMNVFHWHLTDDQGWRIEIKSLPELTEKGSMRAPRVGQWWQRERQQPGEEATYGGYYTQEDIKEVVAYAAKRHVRVIPEVDVPGHSLAALVVYPELACLKAPEAINVGNKFYGIDENSLCAGSELSYEFMEKVLSEVATLFPDEYVHIGGDECYKGFWKECPKCQARMEKEGLKDVNELQSYFIRRMEKLLQAKGKKLIGWDEISEGGLAPEATVMSWRGMKGGIEAAKQGHKVIMTPNRNCYIDLFQGEPSVEPDTYSMCRLSDSYAFTPVPEGVDPSMILGGQGNLWAESVPHFRHAEYMTWPRGWALAEIMWTNPPKTEWNQFVKRVENHFERADMAQINYARSMYNAIITSYKTAEEEVFIDLKTELDDLDIYYTFDNTDPDNYSPRYTAPLSIPKDATWLRVATYRNNKPIGKMITLEIKQLREKAGKNIRKVGNL